MVQSGQDARGGVQLARRVELACRVARAPVPVLITGPNGVGKERIAEIVHANSSVRGGPFVALNCAALPETLAGLVQQAVYARAVEALLGLAANAHASVKVHAIAYAKLHEIRQQSDPKSATAMYLSHRIEQFERDPARFTPAPPIEPPPGMPIGDDWD